ncbi:uncharacterized protein C2845_PM06G05670 [Panicum miliaceum]|uniref:VOC domain-containing protein n=1 Tax=Panicum miliaceum TaxID=4540 RepID=A0A3L6R6D0_PANMI|nr:uncharacterized protein C2845_PM06G05670 [Panicum miliaceum]
MVNTAVSLGGGRAGGVLPLASLNHISIVCRSVEESLRFYTDVLGFVPIRRPGSFDFDGAWYAQRFSNSVVCTYQSTVLLHTDTAALPRTSEDPGSLPEKREINPKDNHISFQCESMAAVERRLKELGIPYVQRCVEEGGINVDQIFFHDPDGFMIEICNCDNLPVIPLAGAPVLGACKRVAVAVKQQHQQQQGGAVPPAPAAAAQCVPSAAAAQAIRVGEEAHISCA